MRRALLAVRRAAARCFAQARQNRRPRLITGRHSRPARSRVCCVAPRGRLCRGASGWRGRRAAGWRREVWHVVQFELAQLVLTQVVLSGGRFVAGQREVVSVPRRRAVHYEGDPRLVLLLEVARGRGWLARHGRGRRWSGGGRFRLVSTQVLATQRFERLPQIQPFEGAHAQLLHCLARIHPQVANGGQELRTRDLGGGGGCAQRGGGPLGRGRGRRGGGTRRRGAGG